jgi:hypothetical protein
VKVVATWTVVFEEEEDEERESEVEVEEERSGGEYEDCIRAEVEEELLESTRGEKGMEEERVGK